LSEYHIKYHFVWVTKSRPSKTWRHTRASDLSLNLKRLGEQRFSQIVSSVTVNAWSLLYFPCPKSLSAVIRSCFQHPFWSIFLFICLFFPSGVRAVDLEELSFDRDIRPILSENCYACHGFDSEAREADLRLDTRAGAVEDSGVVEPGDSGASTLVERILSTDPDNVMPPPDSGRSLTSVQKDKLSRWIDQGAKYETHWAFVPPTKEVPAAAPGMHPIDAFIQSKLASEGLVPSGVAEPATLIRRLSLDLVGLPPTVEEIEAFETAAAEDLDAACDALVDRLLSSPHYGERWARWWLDQARYADSNGYSIDGAREIWLFRDWVIGALNHDMPFDQFTIEQIAGDLLPDATDDQHVATGFHRNTPINQEGGVDREQFRIDSVFDRVATTGTVWLGLTVGCAQCHDHKFDPISQKEFYELFAFFNNQDEPSIKVYPNDVDAGALQKEKGEIEADQKELITSGDGYDDSQAERGSERLAQINEQLARGVSTMVMSERRKPRQSTVFIKGDFTRPDEPVSPGTPNVLHRFAFDGDTEQTSNELPTRLDLARWIVSRENPLTARVIANRVWQQYFGRGLVETESDFGLQGSLPTHPELLDWLAVELRDSGWSLKDFHRQIVSSQTYRQSSRVRSDLDAVDPLNVFLGRQNRLRLDAEIVRDVALVASGLFSPKQGGPPVYPPIPDGVMNLGQVNRKWRASTGEDRYRRGLYTFVYRATPPPALNVFDAPDGQSSCTRRIRSNTPLQALTLLNDAGFFEFAQALEKRIESDGVASAFRRCTSREPTEEELELLGQLDTLGVARALLNLDETINRE